MRILPIILFIFSCTAWSQSDSFIWPTEGNVISTFDEVRKGISIAGKMGQPVVAVSDGKVLFAKDMRGYGNLVIIEHEGSIVTAYAHNKTILVREGQSVRQGQQIAEMGDSDANTIKLHFQLRHMGKPVDPISYFSAATPLSKTADREESATGIVFWKSGITDPPGKVISKWENNSEFYSVTFSPDGRKVLIGSGDKTAVLSDARTGQVLHTWKHEDWVVSVAFSPDGRQVLTGSHDQTAVLRDARTGQTLQTWKHDHWVSGVAFSPDGRQFLTADGSSVTLRETLTGRVLQSWKHEDSVNSIAFSPDGRQIGTGVGGNVILRDTTTGQMLKNWNLRDNSNKVMSIAFSPDGRQLLAGLGFGNHDVRLLDANTGRILKVWKYQVPVTNVSFSRDGRYVLTGLRNDTALLQDARTGEVLWQSEGRSRNPRYNALALSPDGSQVLITPRRDTLILKKIGLPVELQRALAIALSEAEAEHRSLPKILADRQSKLETEKPVKDEFETLAQFNARVSKWNIAAEGLNADIKAHYENLSRLPLAKRARAFERALAQAYGNPELRDIHYEPETARFFATLKASLDPDFKRVVSISIPNDQARAVKAQLESEKNGLDVELRVTEHNELIWGQPRVRIDNKVIVAQFVDKDFIPPSTTATADDLQLKTITPPSIVSLPQTANVKVIEDPALNKLKMEVLQKEREKAELAARQAEEKRLRDRLAELNQQTRTDYIDDLPALISKRPAAKANPNLHVLAIGINDYADVPDVPFADRSAQQFAEIAQKLLGAQSQNVIVLTDGQATLGRLLSRLNTLLNRLGPQDQLLFYYAGHGVPSKDGAGAHLLAQDGGPGSYEQPDLQLSKIYAVIAKSKVGQAKIFIDACFSGRSGKDTIVFEGIAPVVVKPRQSFPDSERIAVMTAGRGDQFSNQDKARGHRLFSYHLMRIILEDGTKLEIGQLHQRLRQRVLEESRRIGPEFEQEPELQGNGRMVLLN